MGENEHVLIPWGSTRGLSATTTPTASDHIKRQSKRLQAKAKASKSHIQALHAPTTRTTTPTTSTTTLRHHHAVGVSHCNPTCQEPQQKYENGEQKRIHGDSDQRGVRPKDS